MNKSAKLVITIGGALIVISLFKRKPVGTVITSEGFDLSMYGGPTTYPQQLMNFAQGIARAEGFYVPGSVPARANNPGDLKLAGKPVLPGTSITRFDSVDQGWDALYRQLYLVLTGQSAVYNLDMTIADMSRLWTATVTQQPAWAAAVASQVGASVDTPLWGVLA